VERHPIQDAAKAMREHWIACGAAFPAPHFWACRPGYSHPNCEVGMTLEREFLKLIREHLAQVENGPDHASDVF
jgi:hypothetical protein